MDGISVMSKFAIKGLVVPFGIWALFDGEMPLDAFKFLATQ